MKMLGGHGIEAVRFRDKSFLGVHGLEPRIGSLTFGDDSFGLTIAKKPVATLHTSSRSDD